MSEDHAQATSGLFAEGRAAAATVAREEATKLRNRADQYDVIADLMETVGEDQRNAADAAVWALLIRDAKHNR